MDRLAAMHVFQTVCEMGGFAPAARRLGLSPSAVTRQVADLEAGLSVRLLDRTTRSVRVTEAGANYLEDVRSIFAQIAEAEESARAMRESPRGTLRVAAPLMFGRIHVAPLTRHYLTLYPDVAVALVLSDRNVQLLEEGIDVAIRLGPIDPSGLIARKVGETRRVLVASPDYLRRRGRPRHPRELGAHLEQPDGLRVVSQPIRPRFTSNNADTAIALAVEGGGFCICPFYQVQNEVASSLLEIVLPEHELAPWPINVLHLSSRFVPIKVRLFLDLVVQQTGSWDFI
jgi:DNA-binding transcriptional LysR family regulator